MTRFATGNWKPRTAWDPCRFTRGCRLSERVRFRKRSVSYSIATNSLVSCEHETFCDFKRVPLLLRKLEISVSGFLRKVRILVVGCIIPKFLLSMHFFQMIKIFLRRAYSNECTIIIHLMNL